MNVKMVGVLSAVASLVVIPAAHSQSKAELKATYEQDCQARKLCGQYQMQCSNAAGSIFGGPNGVSVGVHMQRQNACMVPYKHWCDTANDTRSLPLGHTYNCGTHQLDNPDDIQPCDMRGHMVPGSGRRPGC
jgi:hypothetical protein